VLACRRDTAKIVRVRERSMVVSPTGEGYRIRLSSREAGKGATLQMGARFGSAEID
jgi:hypothetical protein